MKLSLAIGADHAGYELKEHLKAWLEKNGYPANDFGTYSPDSVDYPDLAHPVAAAVEKKQFDFGLLVCSSANGVAITANKHAGIRAAICWNTELAVLARRHNQANVLCLPASFVTREAAEKILDAFLTAPFDGGRHERRVNKISC